MANRRCLACGRTPSGQLTEHDACEFCGGAFETLAEPVTRSCYGCAATFTTDTVLNETFCATCQSARAATPPQAVETHFSDLPFVRQLGRGFISGLVVTAGVLLFGRTIQQYGMLCMALVVVATVIALAFDPFEREGARRRRLRQSWSLESITSSVGFLAAVALGYAVHQLLKP